MPQTLGDEEIDERVARLLAGEAGFGDIES
jgi:hypothetical protein